MNPSDLLPIPPKTRNDEYIIRKQQKYGNGKFYRCKIDAKFYLSHVGIPMTDGTAKGPFLNLVYKSYIGYYVFPDELYAYLNPTITKCSAYKMPKCFNYNNITGRALWHIAHGATNFEVYTELLKLPQFNAKHRTYPRAYRAIYLDYLMVNNLTMADFIIIITAKIINYNGDRS